MRRLDEIHGQTIQTYDENAHDWDKHRSRDLLEKAWLDKFIGQLPSQALVLDVGCGAGEPIAKYLIDHGFKLTGLDASENMLAISTARFPKATWINMDMRELDLDIKFDGIVSWNGFFHLSQEEQRQTLHLFADHLQSEGSLLLTIGHQSGEVTGTVEGNEVYHSSLAPDEYRAILNAAGFKDIEIKLEDKSCGYHSILLAKRS